RHPPTATLFPYTTLFRSRPPASGSRLASAEPAVHYPRRALPGSLSRGAARPRGSATGWRRSRKRSAELAPPLPATRTVVSALFRSEEHTSELQSPCNLVC